MKVRNYKVMLHVWWIDRKVQSFTPHYEGARKLERKEGLLSYTRYIYFINALKQNDIKSIGPDR